MMFFISGVLLTWLSLGWQTDATHQALDNNAGDGVQPDYPNLPSNSCSTVEDLLLIDLPGDLPGKSAYLGRSSSDNDGREPGEAVMSNPWTGDVTCLPVTDVSHSYCVYSNEEFANGRGISFFTSPKIAEHISTLPALTNPTLYDNINVPDDNTWEVKPIPGKGNGLFATRALQRGDLIVAGTPVGVYQSEALANDFPLGYIYLREAFTKLPEPTRQLFMSTMAQYEGDPIMERINTNAFSGEFQDSPHFLLYPETARMNHACRPNTMTKFDPRTLIHTTRASRDIEVGEEITLTYMNVIQPRATRQEQLQMFWGFQRTCHHCSRSTLESDESDARIARIETLQQDLNDWSPSSRATPSMVKDLIHLYQMEELHAATGLGYAFAALVHNSIGRTDEAVSFARRALEAGLVDSGVFGTDEESITALAKDPLAHWSWNRRKGVRSG